MFRVRSSRSVTVPTDRSGHRFTHRNEGSCQLHFMCSALARAEKQGRRFVAAFIGNAFAQDDPVAARA